MERGWGEAMKTIKLESSTETHQGQKIKFDDKKNLTEIVNTPVEGITVEQMRQRIKLLDKIESSESDLSLEDAEFEQLKSIIEKYKFGIVSKHLLSLCEKFV